MLTAETQMKKKQLLLQQVLPALNGAEHPSGMEEDAISIIGCIFHWTLAASVVYGLLMYPDAHFHHGFQALARSSGT